MKVRKYNGDSLRTNDLVTIGSMFFFFNKRFYRHTKPFRRKKPRIGRNDICPCGSKEKYKFCCGSENKTRTKIFQCVADQLIAYD